MKRTYIILVAALTTLGGLFQACKKSDMPSHVAEISYPVITLLGSQVVTINNGATWVDSGASWKDTVTGESGIIKKTLNTSVDSAYYLIYTATNKNGFSSSVARAVAVTNYSGNLSLAGAYTDNLGNADTLQLLSRAFYLDPNIDQLGDFGFIAIKSNTGISIANIQTSYYSSGTGATIPVFFKVASVNYSTPITITYSDSANYQPVPTTVTLVHN